jgi:plasmid stabilization system protein ParE
MVDEDEEPGNFTVRFSPQAQTDAILIVYDMPTTTVALGLHQEFGTAAGKLAYLPERHPVESEVSKQLEMTLRRILVRRWHLYYQVVPDSLDGPLVRIVFIRDARLPPLTQDEADRIKANQ